MLLATTALAGTNTFTVTIDSSTAPDMAPWAEKMRQTAVKTYPAICTKLGTKPRDVSIELTKEFPRKTPAATSGSHIKLSVGWGREHPNDTGALIHELTHVAQAYPKYDPVWLVEAIADYIRFWVYEEPSKRPRINPKTDDYRQGYQPAAAFLAWIEQKYDPQIVTKLNAALQKTAYSDDLFREYTGKNLDELWQECCRQAETEKK